MWVTEVQWSKQFTLDIFLNQRQPRILYHSLLKFYYTFQNHAISMQTVPKSAVTDFFAAANHLSGPLGKHQFTSDWQVSTHFVCFIVSRFVSCHPNYNWRQQKRNCKLSCLSGTRNKTAVGAEQEKTKMQKSYMLKFKNQNLVLNLC